VSLNGVKLAASLAGIDSPLNRVTVEMSAVDERPVSAPWTFENVPWLQGFGAWLAGGMRGGLDRLSVVDATNTNLVPPLVGLWQPDHPMDAPRLGGSMDAWQVGRSDSQTVTLLSPEIFTNRYRIVASATRPSGLVKVSLGGDGGTTNLDVISAPDRRLIEVDVRPNDGRAEPLVGGPFVYRRSAIGWTQAILREGGRVWLVALALVGLARLLALPFGLALPPVPGLVGWLLVGLTGLVLGLATLTLTVLIAEHILDAMPHTVESISYLFQANVLMEGGRWAAAPFAPDFFEQAYVAATPDGRWFGVLPPGQSILLAAGLWAGAPWLVSPIASSLAVGLTVVLGRATHGALVGVLAGLLMLFSPFVLMLSGDMLAHPAGLALTVMMMLGVVVALRKPATLGWLLAGLAMGGLVLTRPLAAVGIGVPLTLLMVLTTRAAPPRSMLTQALIFVVAAAPGVILAGWFNAGLTGSAFLPPLSLWSDLDRIGFGLTVGTRGGHDLSTALGNSWANTAVLLRHLFGWPSYLTLALACVPFVLGSNNRWDRMLLICAVGLGVAHWLYWSDGIIYGPRYAFEAVAALALLTARGATLLARADGSIPAEREAFKGVPLSEAGPNGPAAGEASRGLSGSGLPTSGQVGGSRPERQQEAGTDRGGLTSAPLVAGLVAALFAVNVVGYLPDLVLSYRDYNDVSPAARKVVQEAGLEKAVVFVKSDWPDWQSYGELFLENSPLLDGRVIYVRDLGDAENWRIMARYPDWRWWQLRDLQLTEIRR
jgi:hypothetical protein